MSFTQKFVQIYKALLPSPFTIAVVLSFLVFGLALIWGNGVENQWKLISILGYWENGLWNKDLLVFAMQMMLMLVLGHVLALSTPFHVFIQKITRHLDTTAKAAAIIALFTMLVAFFNWGLGLIFGAIMARKVAEIANENSWKINYPIIGAAGYSGLLVWHGGFSGSSLIKIAEPGHLASMASGATISTVPDFIGFDQTVFSPMNSVVALLLLFIVPFTLYWLGKKSESQTYSLNNIPPVQQIEKINGAERVDHSPIFGVSFGGIILVYLLYKMFWDTGFAQFFTPNNINLLLLSLAILFHRSFYSFLQALDNAIGGASGILIQFPLYFGIMGILKDSDLLAMFSTFAASQSSPDTLPIFTFLSAGFVNILVPSGGGQWAIQGPMIIQTATEIGSPLAKNILAFAYGDQITNMLQPFWALPLLGITGLKAKEILPYTLMMLLVSFPIFLFALWIF